MEWLFIATPIAVGVISRWLWLRYCRHCVDRAVQQGQQIDPAEVIRAAHLLPIARPPERRAERPNELEADGSNG